MFCNAGTKNEKRDGNSVPYALYFINLFLLPVFKIAEINANCALLLSKTFRTLFNDRENGSLSGIIKYVRDNCGRNINNQDIGKHFHYHPNYINRLFVKHFGLSLHQYVINCRIETAVLLLSTTELSIGEIAEKTGWSDSGYFSRVFKEATGYSPEKYKLQ